MPSPGSLQLLAGPLEVKFKAGAFSTWSDSFVRLEGRWICVYKRERDSTRQGAVELGLGVTVTDISNPEASTKFPRRFDLTCNGGLLPKTEVNFRTKSRKDRDLWVQVISTNLQILACPRGLDPRFGVRELAPVTNKMRQDLMLHPIRIRSDLTVKCATGESIVTFLVSQGHVPDRVTGAAFCRQLVSMNLLHHVMWDRDFTDSPEPFVIIALGSDMESLHDTEDDYHVAHFLKYMDSRKFWKYIASPDAVDASSLTAASNVSSGSRRAASSSTFLDRSTSSSDSGRGVGLIPGSDDEAARFSTLSVSNSIPPTPDSVAEKKARKCAVCTKSFNPLRRRHHCRQCRAVICSNCSVVRRLNSEAEGVASSRVCISCKLSSNASFMSETDDVVEGNPPLQTSQSASDVLTSTSSTSDGMGNSLSRRPSGFPIPTPGSSDQFCIHCQNESCSPILEFLQISYPVDPPASAGFVTAKHLENETERLKSVESLLVTMAATPSATRVLRQFCNMAAIASQCPVAVVGLLDRDNYVLGSQYGVSLGAAVPRKQSLAAHTCRSGNSLVCSDLTQDVRFKGNIWRQESLNNAAFYAGIPLTLSNGHTVGALEVFDAQPRFECGEVLGQLQTVVRGLLNLFEEIMTAAAEAQEEQERQAKAEKVEEEAANTQKAEAPAVNPMEAQLLQLLSQTTTTQEQLRTQQGQMVSAISSHSKQIDNLAKQLERIEATLAAKLDGERQVE
ncbi:1-phosphatidylinositol 3-phosphate 5-kinase FAB1 [Phytophthora citrophthora]|uniref:1-phosphatidylinositol 3-phosphate 5-kinase FAB1 n=1 Tax=Phytophthora citrophthora TaxID=4793 RepID=A0AAD9G9K8_9STRA|nr:1-phosphatidylinositol 3-phosphate 5-kinase FAB1 [Phytophthora citrophthora]